MTTTTTARYVNCPELSDVRFLVEGKVVYGHKIILTLLSERFRAMLGGEFLESRQAEITVKVRSESEGAQFTDFIMLETKLPSVRCTLFMSFNISDVSIVY